MRCETDQLRVYMLDYLSIARQMNDSSSLSSAIAGNPRELPERRETGNRSELQLTNTQQHNLWQNIELQIEQIIQAQVKPIELSTKERLVDEDEDRAYSNSRLQSNNRARPNLRSATQVSSERRDITTTRKENSFGPRNRQSRIGHCVGDCKVKPASSRIALARAGAAPSRQANRDRSCYHRNIVERPL
jgi:hypothetical protein